jgi:fucose permease
VQFFVNGVAFGSFVPRLPEISAGLDLSLDDLGLALSIATGIGLMGGLAAPALVSRFGTRRSLISFAAVLVAGLALMSVSAVPAVFVFAYAIMAISDGVVDVAMNMQGSWLSGRRHAPVMNRLHGLWSMGTVVGGLVAAWAAASGVSIRTHLSVVAVVLFAAVVFVSKGLLAHDEEQPTGPVEEVAVSAPERRTSPARLTLILLALSGAFAITTELATSDWAAFRLTEDLGTTAGFAGLGYVAFTSGMTLGRLVGDSVLVRVGSETLLRAAVVVASAGMAGAAFLPNRWLVLVAYGVAGLGGSTFFPKLYDDAAKVRGRPGAGLAWLRTGSGVAAFLIPLTVGTLAASSLSVGTAVAIVTLPSAAGLFLISLRSTDQAVG